LISLQDRAALDIGLFIQAVASMELELDDLLGLANARFDGAKNLSAKYPVQMSTKIKLLPKNSILAGLSPNDAPNPKKLEAVLEMRQRLVHGKIVNLDTDRSGYTMKVAKMGLPEKSSSGQKLVRNYRVFTRQDFFDRAKELSRFNEYVEQLRVAVFHAGEGWPNYLVFPEGDPLNVKCFREALGRNV
jgi:hypothetical protein